MMKLALPLALLSAIMFNLAYEPTSWGGLALFALLPLLLQRRASAWTRLATGWLAGFLTQALGYYWIFYTIRDFGGQSPTISGIGGLLFWLFQGLDLGIWLCLGPWLFRQAPRWLFALGMAGVWFLLQTALYPYVFAWQYGAALTSIPWLAQGAVLWSSYGLSFLAVFFQTTLVAYWPRLRGQGPLPILMVALPLVLIVAAGLFAPNPVTETWRVAVIQPNLIPWAKQDLASPESLFNAHYEPSLALADQQIDLVLWPETAVPFDLSRVPAYQQRIQDLTERLQAGIVTGVVGRDNQNRYYNEMWLFAPATSAPQVYRKERLVVFSEQLPWVFSWARYFDPAIGGFSKGTQNRAFSFRDRQLVPLICFEALFPDYARKRQGHLLLNITNDAWFGKTKASLLHFQHIRMRAIEASAPLVRATNSGVSGWVDQEGTIHGATPLYEKAYPVYEVPVPQALPASWSHVGEGLCRLLAIMTLAAGLMLRLTPNLNLISSESLA